MAETLRDLVVSLSLNTNNFTQNIKSVNKQIQEAESNFKLASAGVKDFDTSANGLSSKLEMLQRKLSLQKDAVSQYEKALSAASTKLTECYTRQQDYANRLSAARQKQADMATTLANATSQYERLRDALGESDSATIAAKENMDAAQQEYNAVTAEVQRLVGQQEELRRSTQNAADAVSTAQTQLNKANASVRETEASIRDTNQQLRTAQSAWTSAGKAMSDFGNRCEKVGRSAAQVGRTLSRTITTPIVALSTASFKAAVDFESAFAGVRKTVDATEEEYGRLSDSIKQMSTEIATSTTDIAAVMESAGQLGIANDNLEVFTRTMIDLGNSTNISADEAATAIAQFANVTGMAQTQFSNFGSALVDLGNNYATTESAIMNMATNMASAGHQVGLSEAQILGFAAALSSVGLEAQAGGTAFSKAMIQMQVAVETGGQALTDFAKVSGMTEAAFKQLWKSDPSAAIQSFIIGLSKMDEQGVSAIATLQEMGFKEVRLRDTLLRATNATELFSSAQETATAAWRKNVALSNEASKRYATTESRLKNLKNTAVLAAQQIGTDLTPMVQKLIDGASDLLEKFLSLDATQRQQIIKWAAIAAATGPAILAFGKISSGIGSVMKHLGSFATAVGSAGGGLTGFLSVLAKSPAIWAAVAVGVVAGTVALIDWVTGAKAAREALKDMADTAENWKNTAADTFYGRSEGLSAFGMSKEDFTRSVRTAQQWKDGLLGVWNDGEKETDEIVQKWTESWKGLTGSTRDELQKLKDAADEAGYDTVSDDLDADIKKLDSMDKEIETLLKKRQNGFLTDNEKLRLQELIDTREAITVKYNLVPDTGADGFDAIEKKVEAAVARAKAVGKDDAYLSVYQDAVVAAAEGMAAINEELDAQYEKEYKLISLITNEDERAAKQKALDTRYAEERAAAARRYAETLKSVSAPVFDQKSIKDTEDQLFGPKGLYTELTKYELASESEKKGMLPELAAVADSLDESSLTEYLGLLTQIQALLDQGMSKEEVDSMFPGVSEHLDQYAGIVEYLKTYKADLPGLYSMLGEAAPEEVLKIATDLDMTGAQARWDEFAANPGSITTDAIVQSYDDSKATVPTPEAEVELTGYDLLSYVKLAATIPNLTLPTHLGQLSAAEWEAYKTNGKVKVWKNGVEIPATPEVLAMLTDSDIAVVDPDDGTVHVFTRAELTEYTTADGVTVPVPQTELELSGYNPLSYARLVASIPNLKLPVQLSQLSSAEWEAYKAEGKIKVWKDGVEIPATPEVLAKLSDRDIAVVDPNDGTVHVFTSASITSYTPEDGVTVPVPQTEVKLTGYNLLSYLRLAASIPDLTVPIQLGQLTASEWNAYVDEGKVKVWKDGVAIPVTPEVLAQLTGSDIVVMDPNDGTVHVFTSAVVTSYDDTGATVPKPQTRVTITGYDLKAYRALIAANPALALEIPTRLGMLSSAEWEAYKANGKVKVWQDGVEIPATPEVLNKLTADSIAVLDSDGTLHVTVTPKLTGSPEAIEELKEEVAEVDQFGTTDLGLAMGMRPVTTLNMIESALDRISRYQKGGFWNKLFGYTNHNTLDQSMKNDFNSDRVADLSAYVAELATAVQNGEEISEEDLQHLQTILDLLNGLQETETGAHIRTGIAQGLTDAGLAADADTVVSVLQGLVSAIDAEDFAGAGESVTDGLAEGMERADWMPTARHVAGGTHRALNQAFLIHSPSQLMVPVGQNVAAGIGEGMKLYDPSADATAMAGAVKAAMGNRLTRLTLVGVGLNAMAGLAAGIQAGQFSVVEAMRTAAQAAVRAAKDELDINSPSRVFRDEVGVMAMRGFGEGIEREAASQARILSNAARFLTGAAREGSIAYNTNDNRRTYQATSNVTVTGNTFQVRDETDIRALATEIATLTKRQQHGQGLRFA